MIGNFIEVIRNIFRFHKLKIFALVMFTAIFALLIFPFSDLTDLVTSKVADATQNTVYLQMDTLGLTLLPGPGVKMDSVLVEAQGMPSITVDKISAAPSIPSLLAFSPGFSAQAEGLFKGDVGVSFKQAGKTHGGAPLNQVSLQGQHIAMAALGQFLRDMGMGDTKLAGTMDLSTQMSVDPTFGEQPKGPLQLSIKNFDMPSHVVNMALGPLQIPEVKLQKVDVKGSMSEGRLTLDNVTMGSDKDPLNGTIKGDVGVKIMNAAGGMVPQITSYDLRVDLTVDNDFQKQASLFFIIIPDTFKSQTARGVHYAFRAHGSDMFRPPEILPYQ